MFMAMHELCAQVLKIYKLGKPQSTVHQRISIPYLGSAADDAICFPSEKVFRTDHHRSTVSKKEKDTVCFCFQ